MMQYNALSFLFFLVTTLLFVVKAPAANTKGSSSKVTFTATGLPPGMIISSTTGNISGIPIQPGAYSVIVKPMFGTSVGNMSLVNITIFPQNEKLPKYFAYNRLLPSGGSISWSEGLAGGGGFILGEYQSNNVNLPVLTTDGVNFTVPSIPPETTFFANRSGNSRQCAAIAGSVAMVLGLDSQGNQTLFTSSSMGAFYQNNIPNDQAFRSWGACVIGSDGISTFYCAVADFNTGNINLWKTSNNPLNWAYIGAFRSFRLSELNGISIARNGQTIVIAVEAYNGPQIKLLYSTDGGNSFSQNSSNTDIASVAFGNNVFLGSGVNGVWTSIDGITWSQISSISVGQLIYSAPERLFFSSRAGVSTNGQYWLGNNTMTDFFDIPVVSSGNGVIYLGNQQLITNKISYASSGSYNAVVGTKTNITCTFSGSGDFTY